MRLTFSMLARGGLALTLALAAARLARAEITDGRLERLTYNNPGLEVDLGVGLWAWPLPMDYDGDGDLDLVVSCHDVPYRGAYFFENPGGNPKLPVFKPGVPVGDGLSNVQVSHIDGKPRLLVPGYEYVGVPGRGLIERVKLPVPPNIHEPGRKIRANQWKVADYDGDGAVDLIVGVGDWTDYGWDNAFDERGDWTNGPLHGFVYLLRNKGTTDQPDYEEPVKIEAGGEPIDVYGMPSPCIEDFDGDGDLDIICGEFLDGFTWFENVGTRTGPEYQAGRRLATPDGEPLRMSLCMIIPSAVDWDRDGDVDLIVGQEDGRVALVENTGNVDDHVPRFERPRFFRQEAHEVKFGALATPVGVDWDSDGDDDLISGNTEGHVAFLENLGGCPPKWAEPAYIEAGGERIRVEAGSGGSIQGPCEAKWGYTTLSVADWDHDGLADLVVNSIWGKVHWHRNVGTRAEPVLAAAEPIRVEWSGKPPKPEWNWWDPEDNELATQWRTTPCVVDLTGDGLVDLVMLDHEGYLALYERKKVDDRLVLLPPKRVFWSDGPSVFNSGHGVVDDPPGLLRLNDGVAGRSGRRKLCFVDWDLDGRVDLLVNSRSVDWLKNMGTRNGRIVFKPMGPLAARRLAGHTTSPTVVDWNADGVPDLLVGAEDGFFYYLENPHVAVEWRFDADGELHGWAAGGHIRNACVTGGALVGESIDWDPILIGPVFEVAATPTQRVEIKMKATRAGPVQLFWTETLEGQYGGFSQKKSNHFDTRPDDQFHVYRIRPFWHAAGKIVRLRLDPPSDATFAIEWIRIVDDVPLPPSEAKAGAPGAISPNRWSAAVGSK